MIIQGSSIAFSSYSADNIRNLFKYLFVAPSGDTERRLEALAGYLERRTATA